MDDNQPMRLRGGKLLAIGLAVAALAPNLAGAREAWSWTLPGELYKPLNRVERAQFDKAREMFEQANAADARKPETAKLFLASANEWKKFRTLYADNLSQEVFAYSIMMEALALHRGKRRYEAVKVYTEVLDYFPDMVWLAAPCLYHRGVCHFDNGDNSLGYKDFRALVEDPKYQKHLLAAGASNSLAEIHWKAGDFSDALADWRRIVETFGESNPDEARHARERLREWMFFEQDLTELEKSFLGGAKEDDLDERAKRYQHMLRWSLEGLGRYWRDRYYDRFHKAEVSQEMREEHRNAIIGWFKEKEMVFAQAKRMWDFLHQVYEAERSEERLVGLVDYLRTTEMDEELRTQRAQWVIKEYSHRGWQRRAFPLLSLIHDPVTRLWTQYQLHIQLEEWEEALGMLDLLQDRNEPELTRRVRWTRAELFERLKRWDEAIQEYITIAEPPETLWALVNCYRKSGKRKECFATLVEIASIFPDHAAKAVFTRAEFSREDGEHKQAVGLYRQLLNHPQWKKTSESSRAHQRLEQYNLATGGANTADLESSR